METSDPIEAIVAQALTSAGVPFVHDSEDKTVTRGLDFFLPGLDCFIECKQFYTERTAEQMRRAENVIVIQGRSAALAFASLLARQKNPGPSCGRN